MNDETSSTQQTTLMNTERASSLRRDASENQAQTTRRLQLMYAGSLVLGIFEDEIATIAEWRRPTPLPHSPPAVLGVVSIQGRMLTALDPLNLFGQTTIRLLFPPGLLVALRGDEQIAMAIEDKGAIIDLVTSDIEPSSEPANRALAGTFRYADEVVNLINVKGLFSAALRGRERRRRRF